FTGKNAWIGCVRVRGRGDCVRTSTHELACDPGQSVCVGDISADPAKDAGRSDPIGRVGGTQPLDGCEKGSRTSSVIGPDEQDRICGPHLLQIYSARRPTTCWHWGECVCDWASSRIVLVVYGRSD